MYTDFVTSKSEAICHLFLHCCFKDGRFLKDEIDSVSQIFVDLQIHKELNFKEELEHYRSYKASIVNEDEYLAYLLKQINPVHDLALYSYCAELCLSDGSLSLEEESLMKKIASALDMGDEQTTVDNLMTQRKAVDMEKIF